MQEREAKEIKKDQRVAIEQSFLIQVFQKVMFPLFHIHFLRKKVFGLNNQTRIEIHVICKILKTRKWFWASLTLYFLFYSGFQSRRFI